MAETVRIAVTGGPGAGKTSVLECLAERGYTIVREVARDIIAARKARGLSPRPPPTEFALAILERELAQYHSVAGARGLVFFDRGIVDALGMLAELDVLSVDQRDAYLAQYPYRPTAFILPPWRAIYHTDSERDQSYADAVHVYASLRDWYRRCGYALVEVPAGTVEERATFMLQSLDAPS